MQTPSATLSLKGRALRLLAQREHSRAELARRLAALEPAADELENLLDDLQAKGFISDQRAAESLVHRHASKLGAGRIRRELQGKGLAPELVEQTLNGLRSTEQERAAELWRRKFGEVAPDAAGQARQMRFLLTRGFDAEVVSRLVRRARLSDAPDA